MSTFDYTYWRELYERDPKQFEKARRAAIEAFIESCNPRNKPNLWQLQREIDLIRRRHRESPIDACPEFCHAALVSIRKFVVSNVHLVAQMTKQRHYLMAAAKETADGARYVISKL